uniref:ATP synthase F0 subunit 6 n=1 Tax=Neoseiulus chebalingensis TaxID=3061192 RepID=UPI0030FEFC08
MVNNLFSMFDPSTNNLSLNWLSASLPLFFLGSKFWVKKSRIEMISFLSSQKIINDMKNNLINKYNKNLIILMTIFQFILTLNLLGILPFVFAPSSHMVLCMGLSFPFWVSMYVTMWLTSPKSTLAHLVPLGTPLLLCPFMILIETISLLIRPLTLAVRLTANMIAGHILLSLLSQTLDKNLLSFFSASLFLCLLLMLEISVAVIQSYVFVILMSLYMNEM